MIVGAFHVEASNCAMPVFSDTFNLESLIKEPTYYINRNTPSCIDFMLTKKPRNSILV